MGSKSRIRRPSFAADARSQSERAGKTDVLHTPLQLSTRGDSVDEGLRVWIHERMARQLGKYAPQIERVMVRFGDENGTKGGVDKACLIQIKLSALPPVVVQQLGVTAREAFDRAVSKAERQARHVIQRHGFSTAKRAAEESERMLSPPATAVAAEQAEEPHAIFEASNADSLIGARVGHQRQNVLDAQQLESEVDTAQPGTSATDRKVGAGHTATRNAKLNTAGMSYQLEDSASGRPSRKSTRRGQNRVKPDSNLTGRTRRAVSSPSARAAR